MISVLLSFFIYVYVMPSVINDLSRTLLLRGKSKSINSFVSKGLHVSNVYALHLGLFNHN